MAEDQKKPVLRDDAEDDDSPDEDFQVKDAVSKIQVRKLKCPICALESCFHNLPYTMQ